MEIKQSEAAIHKVEDEVVKEDEFLDERLANPEPALVVHFDTGRTWDPEPNEDGSMTIRTTPNPTLKVYDTDNGHVLTNAVELPTPLVFLAILTVGNSERVEDLVRRNVRSIENSYDGITTHDIEFVGTEYSFLYDAVDDTVDDILGP